MRRSIGAAAFCALLTLAGLPLAGDQNPERERPTQAQKAGGNARAGTKAQGSGTNQAGVKAKGGRKDQSVENAQGGGEAQKGAKVRTQGAGSSTRAGGARLGRMTDRGVRSYVAQLPTDLRKLGDGPGRSHRFVAGAAARGLAHGLPAAALAVRVVDDRVEVRNRRGDVLFDLDEERAGHLGAWNTRLLGDQPARENAPAFCADGDGHPVWGRQWCLDKGFGLGRSNERLWSRATIDDILFSRQVEADRYDRRGLIDVLGDVVFGRLALHALSLGFDQPLSGLWVAEPQAPHLLRVYSGPEPVAELVDLDGDNRADVMFVSYAGY